MEKNIEQITAVNWWNSIDDIDAKSHLVKKYFYRTNCKVSVNEIVMLYRKAFPSPATLEGEQFTEGEWSVKESDTTIKIFSDTPYEIATIKKQYRTHKDSRANAHLIAASKDLYYALKPFKLLAQEVLDVKNQPQIIYEFNGAKITTEDLSNVLKAMYKACPNTL